MASNPQSGDILFCGAPLTQQRLQDDAFAFDFRRRVGLVFQNPDVQLFSPTVFDELAFGPLQLRWPSEEIRLRVTETLESMEIAHLKDRSPHQLSIGEKKSVALASVLILARDTADRCFIFQNGRIAAGGTPEEVLSDASLLERTNLVRARRSAV
jgi:cobalt/nickel transport system ATP-binding protein